MQELVLLKNVGKSYSGKEVFKNVTMSIRYNNPIVIMGENGCGKSTLLKIIAGVLCYSEGEVIHNPRIKISYMPDRFPKLPFKVEEYLLHMGKIQGVGAKEIQNFINEKFEYFHMPQSYRKQKIFNCSKGTIQKINILQALISKPDLLILDEPFSGLDEDSIENFTELLKTMIKDKTAMVISCHERALAQKFTDNIFIFKEQQCKIENKSISYYLVKFIPTEKGEKIESLINKIKLVEDADGQFATIVEKDRLKDVLEFLFENGYEIQSVNPK